MIVPGGLDKDLILENICYFLGSGVPFRGDGIVLRVLSGWLEEQ